MTTLALDKPLAVATPPTKRLARHSHPQKVLIKDITTSPRSQREFRAAWAEHLVAEFDLEGMGHITLNKRDGHYYCIDGQHRLWALKQLGFENDFLDCDVYEGLTEREEADMFLKLNDQKTVSAFDKFLVGVHAERAEETAIRRLVMAQGLSISRTGGISAVTALRKAYRRQSNGGFSQMLRVIRDSYGEAGFTTNVIDGISLFLHRYDGQIEEPIAVRQLSTAHAGLHGLLNLAAKERAENNQPFNQCVAATAVVIYNRAKGKRLASWWKS